ncbi:hypothetical protein pEaSNUABM11_00297 [Erwinia phage pEa_SNUABM_11]|nr:hypothetical protein pEaSNUABM11_00297 [Erwinia phage pEa_SNUABM_11]
MAKTDMVFIHDEKTNRRYIQRGGARLCLDTEPDQGKALYATFANVTPKSTGTIQIILKPKKRGKSK